jgi:hypothetical protein
MNIVCSVVLLCYRSATHLRAGRLLLVNGPVSAGRLVLVKRDERKDEKVYWGKK